MNSQLYEELSAHTVVFLRHVVLPRRRTVGILLATASLALHNILAQELRDLVGVLDRLVDLCVAGIEGLPAAELVSDLALRCL